LCCIFKYLSVQHRTNLGKLTHLRRPDEPRPTNGSRPQSVAGIVLGSVKRRRFHRHGIQNVRLRYELVRRGFGRPVVRVQVR